MARRKHRDEPELPLFDLPLRPAEEPGGAETAANPTAETPVAEPSGEPPTAVPPTEEPPSGAPPEEPPGTAQLTLVTAAEPGDVEAPDDGATGEGRPVPVVDRLRSGLADLAVQLLMLAVAVAACLRLGVELTIADWPPFVLLGLVFSFFYWVVPLAFWGQTPGMVWVGHVARTADEEPLTVGQAILRWVGAVLTTALAGLPLFLTLLGGRSLSDRVSESQTRVARDP